MIEGGTRSRQAVTLGLALIVSLWVHILGLTLWRYVPPVPAPPTPPPLSIEIELPSPLAEAQEEKPSRQAAVKPEEKPIEEKPVLTPLPPIQEQTDEPTGSPPPPLEEDTISLESQAPEYISYLGKIKANIAQHWIFPPAARKNRLAGRLTAVFTIDKTGQLLKILVETSSGHPILDHAALEAVRGAAPFSPFPEHIVLQRLKIRANFDYRVRYVGVD